MRPGSRQIICRVYVRLKQFFFSSPHHTRAHFVVSASLSQIHWKETSLFLFLNIHPKLQGYMITMSEAGIFWQFRLGKFGVQFESKIFFFFGPQMNTNMIRRLGSWCIV